MANNIGQIQNKTSGEVGFINAIVPKMGVTFDDNLAHEYDIISVSGSVTVNFQKTGVNGINLNQTYQLRAYQDQPSVTSEHILTAGYGYLAWQSRYSKVSNNDVLTKIYPSNVKLTATRSSKPSVPVNLWYTAVVAEDYFVNVTAAWSETVLSSESILHQTRGSITLHAGSCTFRPATNGMYTFPERIMVPAGAIVV